MKNNSKWAKKWAGNTYGTNTGKFFLTLDYTNEEVTGLLRFHDSTPGAGIAVYDLTGEEHDGKLCLTGKAIKHKETNEVGELKLEALLTSKGNLHGDWETSLGTGGTFQAWPHDYSDETGTINKLSTQLHTKNVKFGPIFLDSVSIKQILDKISEKLPAADVVITYEDSNSVSKAQYAEAFLEKIKQDSNLLSSITKLRFFASSSSEDGINNNVISLEFGYGNNILSIQGIDETWVFGACELIKNSLKKNESAPKTVYRKFGSTINYLLFALVLVVLPSINTIMARSIFVIAVFVWLWLFGFIQNKMSPLLVITNQRIPKSQLWWNKAGGYILEIIKVIIPVIAGWLIDHYFPY